MKKPWGGRFKDDTSGEVEAFTSSISFDARLAPYDIGGSIAHAKTLERAGLISKEEANDLISELERIAKEIGKEKFRFKNALEDVHMNIEAALIKRLGEDVGGLIHTARSRNDQVAVDTRLFVKMEARRAIDLLKEIRITIIDLADKNIEVVMPGYTHLQRAQPILLSHHLLAYWEMFHRDSLRFKNVLTAADVMPLGSGALAGVPYRLDREYTAKLLGFSRISTNSVDAVSDRDYILDYLASASIAMMHLSRLAEELVLFSSAEYGFVTLPDRYATGSSIMPQKKNPDVPELVRGKTGRVIGNLVSLLTTMKGLPLAYMRDMQEDKEALFDAVDTLNASLSIMEGLLSAVRFNGDKMKEALTGGFITATDAADYLVRKGVSFREAHGIVGKIVADAESRGKTLFDLSVSDWREFSPRFDDDIIDAVKVESSISSRNIVGGTARERVVETIKTLRKLEKGKE
ncbi:MAG: argininosuccinate lyase [Deltaproteobacteria bacterium]|uniref:Argininosuccinate lyase n=1 Tax=Candidatus Zymogenus saltonus TaxID=2844893 RepID=A0A9D8PKM6_9DELT|nr:argininosuccinate lyase [Candidatus Zymogenus saltonus]